MSRFQKGMRQSKGRRDSDAVRWRLSHIYYTNIGSLFALARSLSWPFSRHILQSLLTSQLASSFNVSASPLAVSLSLWRDECCHVLIFTYKACLWLSVCPWQLHLLLNISLYQCWPCNTRMLSRNQMGICAAYLGTVWNRPALLYSLIWLVLGHVVKKHMLVATSHTTTINMFDRKYWVRTLFTKRLSKSLQHKSKL